MHDKYAKMKIFGRYSGGSKGWSKKAVSRWTRRVGRKLAIKLALKEG